MKWVYVGGTFDLFHAGHVRFLEQVKLRARGTMGTVVALNTDEFAGRYKREPVMTLPERIAVVEGCRWVDKVVVNVGNEDSWDTITSLIDQGMNIEYVAHGDDWVGPTLMRQMNLTHGGMAAYGIELLHVPYTRGISSSDIISRIRDVPGGDYVGREIAMALCCGDPADCSC